jgi:hypothetical protein
LGGEANDGKMRGGVSGGAGRWVRDRGWTDEDDYGNTEYKSVGLWDRLVWLRRRGSVLDISMRLSRVQTRRIAGQTAVISGYVWECEMLSWRRGGEGRRDVTRLFPTNDEVCKARQMLTISPLQRHEIPL